MPNLALSKCYLTSQIRPDRQGDGGADCGRVSDLVLRQRPARPLDEAERREAEGRSGDHDDVE